MELTRNWQLALSLQESGVRIDELVRLQFAPCISTIPSSEVLRLPRACSHNPESRCIVVPQTLGVCAATIVVCSMGRPGIRLQRIVMLDSREKHLHRRRGLRHLRAFWRY